MSSTWYVISSQPDGSIRNRDARKLVRQNAMKSFRRKQRLQGVEQFQQKQAQVDASNGPSRADPMASVAGTASYFSGVQGTIPNERQDEQECGLDEQTALLQCGPGDALDPFHPTAMYNSDDAPRLFMHCRHKDFVTQRRR